MKTAIECEFTDEQVEGAVMAMLKHSPMAAGEIMRKFSVECWDTVNDALDRLLADKKVRETERLDGIYFIRNDYQEWVHCPLGSETSIAACHNYRHIENPLFETDVNRCPACGREL